jgi:hypothetical protein
MKWLHPPIIKVYEAMGSIADGRIEISEYGKSAKVYSSSRNKSYNVSYDPTGPSIMTNDNASFFRGTLGYPAIAFLMKIGVLSYDEKVGNFLKGIPWKDLNIKFKQYHKTIGHIFSTMNEEEKNLIVDFTTKVDEEINALNIGMLGKRIPPPDGY